MMPLIHEQIAYIGLSRSLVRVWRCIVAAWRVSHKIRRG